MLCLAYQLKKKASIEKFGLKILSWNPDYEFPESEEYNYAQYVYIGI